MIISVALCTYNGEKFLREQLESILLQSVSVNEVIICDDCSTDETVHIINEFLTNYSEIFKLHVNYKSLGTIKNFEKAVSLTTGDLIFLADQDDVWYPHKVEKMVEYFESNKKCQLLFTDGDLINDSGEELNDTIWGKYNFDQNKRFVWKYNIEAFKELMRGKNKITGATICFNKRLKEIIFPFQMPLGYWHDGWLGLHAAASEGLFFLEESLIKYRIHSNQQIGITIEVNDETTIKGNKENISTQKYFYNLIKVYPNLKNHIPYNKKSLSKQVILKIRSYFNFFK